MSSPEIYGQFWSRKFVAFILRGRFGRGFYLENKNGDLVAGIIVTHHRAMYKNLSQGADGLADPMAFGVSPVLALRVTSLCGRVSIKAFLTV